MEFSGDLYGESLEVQFVTRLGGTALPLFGALAAQIHVTSRGPPGSGAPLRRAPEPAGGIIIGRQRIIFPSP